jgi:hypothetical protein
MAELQLSPAEARVIGALVEKSITTPAYYPMTVNAIMLAANQKTSRHPVMSLTEGEVGAALTDLEQKALVARAYPEGRAPKWRHDFQHQLLLDPKTLAVLAALMLRGPQTLSELRAHAAGLGGPTEPEALTATLKDLSDRAQPLVTLLPRAPGQKESRYAHLLSGVPDVSAAPPPPAAVPAPGASDSRIAALEERLAALEVRVAALEQPPP